MNLKEKLKLWKKQLIFALIQPEINEPFRKTDFITKSEFKRQVNCVMTVLVGDVGAMLYDIYAEKKMCRNYLLEKILVNLLYLQRVRIDNRQFEESVSNVTLDNSYESKRKVMEDTIRENNLIVDTMIKKLILSKHYMLYIPNSDPILDKAVGDTPICLSYLLDATNEPELKARINKLRQLPARQIPFLLNSPLHS